MKSSTKLSAAALMEAAAKGELVKVRAMLASGATLQHLATKSQNAVTEAAFGWWGGWEKPAANRLKLIQELVKAGCPVQGEALFRPIDLGELELVRFLIHHGANVNVISPKEFYSGVHKGSTPLGVAVGNNRLEMIEELAKSGADLNQVSSIIMGFGVSIVRPPIVWATYGNKLEAVRLLIKLGADLNATDKDGNTALLAAIELKYKPIAKLLIEAGADPNKAGHDGWTPLALTREKGPGEIAKLLEQTAAVVPKAFESKEELMGAAKTGNLKELERLIKEGADIHAQSALNDYWHKTALHVAAAQGHVNIIQTLLKAGAKVDALGATKWTPLMCAAEAGHVEAARVLVAVGADVNATYNEYLEGKASVLMIAARAGRVEMAKFLIEKGANATYRTSQGYTALSYAAVESRPEVVKVLADAAAKTRKDNRHLDFPLFMAAGMGNAKTLRALLAVGANPNATGMLEGKQQPALKFAMFGKNKENVAILKEALKASKSK